MLAATAVVSVVLPSATLCQALYITAGFMALYIIAGGTRGAGMAGMLKLVLLCGAMVVCRGLALSLAALFCGALPQSLILACAVFSLGIRGSVNFVTLLFVLWGKGESRPPLRARLGHHSALGRHSFQMPRHLPFSPLFPAIACAAAIMGAGTVKKAHPG